MSLPVPDDPTSRGWEARYEDVTVQITRGRWSASIFITKDAETIELVASADSYYTERDGLWLGTAKQTVEELA